MVGDDRLRVAVEGFLQSGQKIRVGEELSEVHIELCPVIIARLWIAVIAFPAVRYEQKINLALY